MLTLSSDPYWMVTRDPRQLHVVRVARLEAPFESSEVLEASCSKLQKLLDNLGRSRHCLYLDIRRGPLRTDPAFERMFASHRQRLLTGFSRVAIVVSTAVGKLQVQRHAREDRIELAVFDDEKAALTFVSEKPLLISSR